MKAVITRVSRASVSIEGNTVGSIGKGYLILLGVTPEDDEKAAAKLAEKISKLRVFSDDEGKMNLSIMNVGGDALVVSQFTLMADCRKGNRPSFVKAAGPDLAVPLYEAFMKDLTDLGIHVEHGEFGADMQVESINDGPVTIIMDTNELAR